MRNRRNLGRGNKLKITQKKCNTIVTEYDRNVTIPAPSYFKDGFSGKKEARDKPKFFILR